MPHIKKKETPQPREIGAQKKVDSGCLGVCSHSGCKVNGETRQDSSTADMIFDCQTIVYGNFDVILDRLSSTALPPHAPCYLLYLLPVLIGA